MKPYWVTTKQPMSLGVGITAHSEDDAKEIFLAVWPNSAQIVAIKAINDISEIDENHVAPNMESWLKRGIWFPRGVAQSSN